MSAGEFWAAYVWFVVIGLAITYGIIYLMGRAEFFFFFPKEGQIYAIMKGEQFHRFLPYAKGWELVRQTSGPYEGHDVMEQMTDPEAYDSRVSWLTRTLGIAVIGLPPFYHLHTYSFEWVKLGRKDENTSYEPIARREDKVNSLYFQFPYVFVVKGAETKDNVTVDVETLVTVRARIPYQILFMTHDWLAQLSGYVGDRVKVLVGKQEISQVQKISERAFHKQIISLNDAVPQENVGLMGLIGIEIVDANFVEYEIQTDPETEKALQAVEVARQRAKARIIAADAERSYLEKTIGYVAGDDPSRRVEAAKWVGDKPLPTTYVEANRGSGPDTRPSIVLPASFPGTGSKKYEDKNEDEEKQPNKKRKGKGDKK